LKKPTSIAPRDNPKRSMLPSPSHAEERKRSNSVISAGSINSTASSTTVGGEKKKN
jgi:hypothetical protein